MASAPLGTRLAFWIFVAFVAFAFPYIILGPADYHWFLRDEWIFFTERRSLSMDSLFEPFNVHLVAVPVLVYIVLWNLFGVSTYLPYQASVVGLHLTAAVLLRVIMRRSGVSPWIATAAASTFVLFGPGAQNIVWAFQIGFTGALVLGLVQILLADHDGPVSWRDGLGVAAGVLAVMCTGVGITMALVTGMAVLLRRGWRVAVLYTAPLALVYGMWVLLAKPDTTGPFGRPGLGLVVDWVRIAIVGTFEGMGHFTVLAAVLAGVLIGGAALSWAPAVPPVAHRFGLDVQPWRELSRRWALPAGMLAGSLVFPMLTAVGRSGFGVEHARASRYVHLGAALTLPALAMAVDALVRRWRFLTIPLIALLLIPLPANLDGLEADPFAFGPSYMFQREQILTNAIRMPFARDVPRDVRPVPDPYDGNLTIGFLLDAHDDGKLPASDSPVTPALRNELRIRLGLAQRPVPHNFIPTECREVTKPLDLSPDAGDIFWIKTPVAIVTLDERAPAPGGDEATSPPVVFNPPSGIELTAELDGLDLQLRPPRGASTFGVCGTDPLRP